MPSLKTILMCCLHSGERGWSRTPGLLKSQLVCQRHVITDLFLKQIFIIYHSVKFYFVSKHAAH